jgi:hypothetical protein
MHNGMPATLMTFDGIFSNMPKADLFFDEEA